MSWRRWACSRMAMSGCRCPGAPPRPRSTGSSPCCPSWCAESAQDAGVSMTEDRPEPALTIDALGKKCPIPIIMLAEQINDVPLNAVVAVLADDPAAVTDVPGVVPAQVTPARGLLRASRRVAGRSTYAATTDGPRRGGGGVVGGERSGVVAADVLGDLARRPRPRRRRLKRSMKARWPSSYSWPPTRSSTCVAVRLPIWPQRSSGRSQARPARKPARKASPTPVGSALPFSGAGATWMDGSPWRSMTAPLGPSVVTRTPTRSGSPRRTSRSSAR